MKPFTASVALGSLTGGLVLGAGGRAAMRLYALVTEDTPYFTASGSATVLVVGMLAGAACGATLWLGDRFVRGSAGRKQIAFWIGLAAITAYVLSPWTTLRLEIFVPLALIFGIATVTLWRLIGPARRIQGTGPALRTS